MKTAMHFDDGQDMFAPPMPPGDAAEAPPLIDDAKSMYWIMPVALLASGCVFWLAVWGLIRLLK